MNEFRPRSPALGRVIWSMSPTRTDLKTYLVKTPSRLTSTSRSILVFIFIHDCWFILTGANPTLLENGCFSSPYFWSLWISFKTRTFFLCMKSYVWKWWRNHPKTHCRNRTKHLEEFWNDCFLESTLKKSHIKIRKCALECGNHLKPYLKIKFS